MANQWPTEQYHDGSWGTSVAVGLPIFQQPIPSDPEKYVFTQEFMVDLASYTPLALNTSHSANTFTPDLSAYFLVEEGELRDMGGGKVRFTRTFAKKPTTYDDWEMFAYPFIGYYGSYGPNELIPTGRSRQTMPVMSRVEHAFYLVGSTVGSITVDYANPGLIPVIEAQKYRLTPAGMSWWMDVDFLGDAPPFSIATTPNRTTYANYATGAAASAWGSGTVSYAWSLAGGVPTATVSAGTTPGQICAEDSRLDRWKGNIWLRRTRWVLAK